MDFPAPPSQRSTQSDNVGGWILLLHIPLTISKSGLETPDVVNRFIGR